ncbi:hypothetical protein [Enterococcus sp. DA9]|uniref:hypothetical protein n=1 Tax=Enterococcus sp. DA9 TaxID=2603296 RepID=UPI0016509E58|nr:hypothetical protein [Enterococcus sp. DA9]
MIPLIETIAANEAEKVSVPPTTAIATERLMKKNLCQQRLLVGNDNKQFSK